MNLRIFFCLATTAISIRCSYAQEKAETSLQFLGFPQQESPKPIELLIGDNKTISIETPGNELSPTYKVKGLASIVVGITTKNEKGESIFQTLGQAPALASPKQIILLMRKGETNNDGFVVVPVDGDLAKFSGGNYFFINASNLLVGGKIGDKTFGLKPGQKSLIQPASNQPNGGCQVTLSYQKDTKWKVFYDTRWTVNKRFRSLIFFYQDPETGRLGVAPIIDLLGG